MSQWNNSYACNNQYQDASTWNSDANSQYVNQAFYPSRQYEPNAQYVGFDEFLTQMQNSSVATASATPHAHNTATYSNIEYKNHPAGQLNYLNATSSAQNIPLEYNYPSNASGSNRPVYKAQNQYDSVPSDQNSFSNDLVFKSNLTATATEFVPKNLTTPSSSTQNIQSEFTSHNGVREPKTNSDNASSNNWRDRSHSTHQNPSSRRNETGSLQIESSKSETRQEPNRGYRNQSTSHNRAPNSRNFESNYHNTETGNRRYESNNRNYDSTQNYESNNESNRYDSSNRSNESNNYDSNNRSNERSKRYDSSNKINDAGYRSNDSNSRYESNNQSKEANNRHESSSRKNESNRYEPSNSSSDYDTNRSDNRGQSKSSSKKSKESDTTFYNSSLKSQDVRSGKEGSGRSRHWVGTQRLRTTERNFSDDEQFANNYLQYKDRPDRTAKSENSSNQSRTRNKPANTKVDGELTQRDRLSEQLDKGTLECLVCCERVKQNDQTWSCTNCYHVMHLRCIKKWALSSIVELKWRCPACQNTSDSVPNEYRCLCGATRIPDYAGRSAGGAHTCGRTCKRPRGCTHPCPLLCHPGPCPPCQATITKTCGCGAESRTVVCSDKSAQVCKRPCPRMRACAVHPCGLECHEGPCDPCAEVVTQVCYCMVALSRTVPCSAESGGVARWACGAECSHLLTCGAHSCKLRCHAPPCPKCPLLPEAVLSCPCGRTQVDPTLRQRCTDAIPTCDNICAKPLTCGPAGDKHFCKVQCHEGECPACPDSTLLQCRCGHSSREVRCEELPDMLDKVLCQKKCNKKLSCGRHRCRTVCCAAQSHSCAMVCARTLSCQLHRCEEFCHTGHCAPCPRVSFEELTCECGAEVLLPPVRCGSKPPACTAECRRRRPCGHAPHHSCHSGDCPPCVVLTAKMCYGKHEERKTIPCSQEEFSCGLACGKPLPCGKHSCIKTCHKGPCDTGKCTQPCNEKRPSCGHPCAAPCHSGAGAVSACPSAAPCRRLVRATCPCARRHADRQCTDNARDLARIMSTLAATKMQEGGSMDISEMRPGAKLKTLECDDECRVEARTRQLALALQICNPDVSAKLAPRYSDHLRTTAAKEPAFAQKIHDKLTELVQLAKKSKQKTRAHSFPSMNWQKRQFIHELCEHFGCESVAYDAEPNRNVVATADREKSWLPAMSVLEVLAREAGKRRVPGPMLRAPAAQTAQAAAQAAVATTSSKSSIGWATLTSTNAWAARSQASQRAPTAAPAPPAPAPAEKIDYFDNPPDN